MIYPPSRALFIRWHLGLGDALICNGLVRHFAKSRTVIVPAKHHNVPSATFMFRDDPNIQVLPVQDDKAADEWAPWDAYVLKLGMFGENFSFHEWDRVMYKQAGVPFDVRWTGFKVERHPSSEIQPPSGKFAFVHDDHGRGMDITDAELPELPLIYAEKQPTIFSYCRVIEEAEEIHVVDSAFLSLVESIPTKAKRLVLHRYARPNSKENGYAGPPTLRKDWKIIK